MFPRFILLTFGMLAVLGGCKEEEKQAEVPARPVLVETVAFAPRVPERTFVATIRPRVESDLGFRVPGKVAERFVSVGDVVKVGTPLASLDSIDLRLQQEQAEAEFRAASASVVQAEAELKRINSLIREGWSTAAGLERQKAATEEAHGRLTRAERALSLAQNAFSYATMASDTDGVVTATQIEPGQVVTAGQTAIRIARTGEKEAIIAVPEAQIAVVKNGKASMTLWSNPDKRYEVSLRELSPSADPATRTYLARFSIPQADKDVELGMTATVTIDGAEGPSVARLPISALFNQGDGPSVWVVDVDGRLFLRPVSIAAYEAQDVLISKGVKDGDKVVTLGVHKLDSGQRVRIVQAMQF